MTVSTTTFMEFNPFLAARMFIFCFESVCFRDSSQTSVRKFALIDSELPCSLLRTLLVSEVDR